MTWLRRRPRRLFVVLSLVVVLGLASWWLGPGLYWSWVHSSNLRAADALHVELARAGVDPADATVGAVLAVLGRDSAVIPLAYELLYLLELAGYGAYSVCERESAAAALVAVAMDPRRGLDRTLSRAFETAVDDDAFLYVSARMAGARCG